LVEVANKSPFPLHYDKGLEIARIQMIKLTEEGNNIDTADMTQLLQIKHIFDQIPHIHSISEDCYCRTDDPADISRVFIQLSDRYGLTSSADNLVTTIPRIGDVSQITPLTPLKTRIMPQEALQKPHHQRRKTSLFYSGDS